MLRYIPRYRSTVTIAITVHAAPNVQFRPLRTDGLNCIMGKDSPLAALNEVGLNDVVGYPQVVCLPASIRRKGSAAQGSIPRTDDEHTITCSTTNDAQPSPKGARMEKRSEGDVRSLCTRRRARRSSPPFPEGCRRRVRTDQAFELTIFVATWIARNHRATRPMALQLTHIRSR